MRKPVLLGAFAALLLAIVPWSLHRVFAAAPAVDVQLATANAQPRKLEDTTQTAVLRDYKAAWETLAAAMDQNRTDQLDSAFVGFAREHFAQAIAQQKENGLRRHYIDHGHKVEAVFYSYDGSALQLKDTANVEIELMDGSKVVGTQTGTISYTVLMTPAETNWKVRDLEAVPSF